MIKNGAFGSVFFLFKFLIPRQRQRNEGKSKRLEQARNLAVIIQYQSVPPAGTFGRPGMVIMSPAMATIKPARWRADISDF